jgi:hypothetical protein
LSTQADDFRAALKRLSALAAILLLVEEGKLLAIASGDWIQCKWLSDVAAFGLPSRAASVPRELTNFNCPLVETIRSVAV